MKMIALILLGYLSGSVMYADLIPRCFCRVDITRLSQDENPGTVNAFVHAGVPAGILVLILELGKGFAPVFLASRHVPLWEPLFALVLVAPVIGHAFPFWRRGRGGKCIAVSFGVLLGILPEFRPLALLAFFYLLFSLVIVISPHFFRTIVTFSLFCLGVFFFAPGAGCTLGCAMIAGIVIWRHFAHYRGERWRVRFLPPKKQTAPKAVSQP